MQISLRSGVAAEGGFWLSWKGLALRDMRGGGVAPSDLPSTPQFLLPCWSQESGPISTLRPCPDITPGWTWTHRAQWGHLSAFLREPNILDHGMVLGPTLELARESQW